VPKKRRFAAWIWIIGILGIAAVCGVIVVVSAILAQQAQQQSAAATHSAGTAIAEENALATLSAGQAAATATSAAESEQATATAEFLAMATATAEMRVYEPRQQALAWSVFVSDDFAVESNDWAVGEYEDALVTGSREIDGVYRWDMVASSDFVWWAVPDVGSVSDFYLTADARVVEGVSNAQYGLIFRRVDSENYYIWLLRDDGQFKFSIVEDGQWGTMIDWTVTTEIKSREVNRLEAVAMGDQFVFYINEQYLGQFSDDHLASGKTALVVGLLDGGDSSVVEFDNFELRIP
jgi:hypothetical protein